MSDLVERLRDLERVEYELAHESDCPPEATANWKYAETCREAAARIEQLEAEIKTAIRQFEDGNRLECHRTLCTVIYGKQY